MTACTCCSATSVTCRADSAGSNYFQARELLTALALPPESLLSVPTQLPLAEAAAAYERELMQLLSSGVRIGLGLLGLGAEGHTASLFSEADLARARGHYAIAVQRPDGRAAVSVTPELLATVSEPVFVVAGPEKRDAVRALCAGDPQLIAWRAVQGCENAEAVGVGAISCGAARDRRSRSGVRPSAPSSACGERQPQ